MWTIRLSTRVNTLVLSTVIIPVSRHVNRDDWCAVVLQCGRCFLEQCPHLTWIRACFWSRPLRAPSRYAESTFHLVDIWWPTLDISHINLPRVGECDVRCIFLSMMFGVDNPFPHANVIRHTKKGQTSSQGQCFCELERVPLMRARRGWNEEIKRSTASNSFRRRPHNPSG